MSSTLAAALAWAGRGFRIFPLYANSKDRPVYGQGWPDYATVDASVINQWWRDPITGQERDYNVAVLTDEFCVVDLDVKKEDGPGAFRAIGGGPHTLTVRTPSGGYHLYYKAPRPIAGNQNIMGAGIDVRGWHNFTLAPGSSVNGSPYALVADAPIAPMPEHFWPFLREPGDKRKGSDSAPAVDLDTPAQIAAVASYLQLAKPAVEGQHGDLRTLTTAMECRDLGVSAAACLDLMLEHYNDRCEPPWDAEELQAKIENAYLYAENQAGVKAAAAQFAGIVPMDPIVVDVAPHEAEAPFRPFTFGTVLHPSALLPRAWVLDRFLELGEVTTLIAGGGVGKSQYVISVACLLAVGAPEIFGFRNLRAGYPMKSIIYNAEDTLQEMSKRVAAFCTEHGLDQDLVTRHVSVTSGRDFRLSIATGGRVVERTEDNDTHIGFLISAALDPSVVMMSLDPLSKIHTADPSNNQEMNQVMSIVDFITTRANVAMLLPAHTSKGGSAGGYAGSAHAGLGAVAVTDSARINYTLSNPTDEDVIRYGLSDDERYRYLRLDDAKMNRSLRSAATTWIEKTTINLATGDAVGAFREANMHTRVDRVREQVAEVLWNELVSAGKARFTLSEAQAALVRGDPLFGQLPASAVRSRIERFLAAPVELPDGGTLRLVVEGSQKFIVFS